MATFRTGYDAGMSDCEAQRLRSMTLSCKRYLKQNYSTHVVLHSRKDSLSVSPDYCRYFALSDPYKNEELRESCTHSHSIECDRCEELRHLFASLHEAIGNVL